MEYFKLIKSKIKNFLLSPTTLKVQTLDFTEIKEFFDRLNLYAGCPLYKVQTKSYFWRCHIIFLMFSVPVVILELFYFTFFINHDLLGYISTGKLLNKLKNLKTLTEFSFILQAFQLMCSIFPFCLWINSVIFKDELIELLQWAESLPDHHCFYMEHSFKTSFIKARNASSLANTFLIVIIGSACVSIIIALTSFKHFIGGESFALPLFCHLPFLPPVIWPFYLLNLVHQIYSIFVASIWCLVMTCCTFTIIMHILVHLESIQIFVGSMRKGIVEKSFEEWIKLISQEVASVKR